MRINFPVAKELFRQGRFQEILDESRANLEVTTEALPTVSRLLLGEVFLRTGSPGSASRLASEVLAGGPEHHEASQAQAILGLAAWENGLRQEALRRLRQSVRLARTAGDARLTALSLLFLFRFLSELGPSESAKAALKHARDGVSKAGDPHLVVLLHEFVSRAEAQNGDLVEADRHLRIAREVVTVHPNAWLEQLCAVNAFCIAFLDSDLGAAKKHLAQARSLLPITGSLTSTINNNEAHLMIRMGDYSKAAKKLEPAASGSSTPVQVAALDGLVRLYLASNRIRECDEVLERLQDLHQDGGVGSSFALRWSLVTRVRLLLDRGELQMATDITTSAIASGAARGNRPLVASVSMLQAEALGRSGDAAGAREL